MNAIDTEALSARYRARALDLIGKRLLITRFDGSDQARDLSEPANCNGFGRIRHFRRQTSPGWPSNPLPIEPAGRALWLPPADVLRAQVFQNSVCNWRCWYCFVDFDLLNGDQRRAGWLQADEMLDLYLGQDDAPAVIDLTGGQPDLTPEWVPWMMEALRARGLSERVYLWSDDNLSNDYFWRFLPAGVRAEVAAYRHYGRVCCFKGFDADSFAFNTRAHPALFDQQFALMGRLLDLGLDLYAYVTLTTPNPEGIADGVRRFLDRLQALDPNLPLRTIPLEVQMFSPVEKRRPGDEHRLAIRLQWRAIEVWQAEILARYPEALRAMNIAEVPLKGREPR